MSRGKRTKTKKQDLIVEICEQIGIPCEDSWKSGGSTITADAFQAILESIAKKTGIPPTHLMNHESHVWRILHKSMAGMVLALEIINKPTINYRMETFLFLVVNSWELLFKAKIIADKRCFETIKDKDNPYKTISFEKALKSIFTSEKHPVRMNLIRLEELRNEAMHLYLPDVPQNALLLFQACIFNYEKCLKDWFKRSLCEYVSKGMMFLVIEIEPGQIHSQSSLLNRRLTNESLEFLNSWQANIRNDWNELSTDEKSQYMFRIDLNLMVTSNPKKSDLEAVLDQSSNAITTAIKERDNLDRYPKSYTQLMQEIKSKYTQIKQGKINEIIKTQNLKNNKEYSNYAFRNKSQKDQYYKKGILPKSIGSNYNQKAIDFISSIIEGKK